MMTAFQHAAYVQDAREAHALYASMRTDDLLDLKAALELDMRAAPDKPETLAFGGGRLALIAAVLKTRGVERGTSPPDASPTGGDQ